MEKSFNLASRVPGISSPCPLRMLRIKEKLFVSKTCLQLGSFSNQDHSLVSGSGHGRLRVSCPLMLGSPQESYLGEKHMEEENGLSFRSVRTLLIDNYDSYTYNIYQELAIINGVPPVVVHNDEWTWDHICHNLYNAKAFDNIVISPGPGSPTCPADIGICSRLLSECKDIPILGVCLGHQALGYVHGARVVHAPQPVHGRLSEIEHIGCNLFHNIPSGKNSGFKVVRYHSLVLDADSLPKELIPIAWTSSAQTQSFLGNEQYGMTHGVNSMTTLVNKTSFQHPKNSKDMEGTKVLMGVMHSKRPHYGVQFHPESVATRHGRQIFKNFRNITLDHWLNSSPDRERKISHAHRPRKEPPMNKKLAGNGTVGYWFDIYKNVLNQHKSMDLKYLKLRWRKFGNLANQVGGSRNIFCELFENQKAEDTFWLDSSSVDQRRARFSFMGGRGGSLWKQITFWLSDQSNATGEGGGYLSIVDAQGSVRRTFLEDGFLDFLNKELQSFRYDKEEYEGLPFDFCGGYIGFIGYGIKVECGMVSNRHKSSTPDACFFFADRLVVIDHSNGDVYVLSIHNNHPNGIGEVGSSESLNVDSWLNKTEQQLLGLKTLFSKKINKWMPSSRTSTPCKEGFVIEKSRDQYIKDVDKCLNFIRDGESYELCLTTQMRKCIRDLDALGLYLSLRERNPAPYAAWLHFSKDDLCICCSSPERFLRLDGNGILEAKPIKGTITRGTTPEEDEQLKLQLQHSEKDQAENLMIVDLLRNDLGRVCEPGTVHVPRLMEVESYATVHTLVSTIRGEKSANLSPIECVRAAFPGGSMTGAPKLRSMELLDSIEGCSRGVYSGSIGFFSYNQTFDLNIVIRTVVIHKNEASIGAGGAIVALSNPEDEYEEMILKARAPAQTVIEYQTPLDSFSRIYMKK